MRTGVTLARHLIEVKYPASPRPLLIKV
jgi:hypothetical protein